MENKDLKKKRKSSNERLVRLRSGNRFRFEERKEIHGGARLSLHAAFALAVCRERKNAAGTGTAETGM